MSWQIFNDGTRVDYDGDAPEDEETPDEPDDNPEPSGSPPRR